MAAVLVLALVVPLVGLLAVLLAGGHRARPLVLAVLGVSVLLAAGIAAGVWQTREALVYVVGGWQPPLGLTLRADGLSAVMLLVTAGIGLAVAVFADFRPENGRESRGSFSFGFLLLGVVGGLNAAFLGNDLFNLYVALELIAFAAVPLVCLQGTAPTYQAALRYMIFALTGSALYLLGAVLLYGRFGTLDLTLLAERIRPDLMVAVAVAAMTVGLAAKTALFPLHLWLPPAHAGAPPAASALLSALVVKGSFFLTVRLWFDLAPWLLGGAGSVVLGLMAVGAIGVGGAMALRQDRLKLLVAYSTVAQIGYLFLIFPVGLSATALAGGMFQAVAHALAKAAMFLASGLLAAAAGSDKLSDLRGVGRRMPIMVLAFGLAALSLLGVPPTGGFVAKWLLVSAAFAAGQWVWAAAILAGGLLAGGYLFRALAALCAPGEAPAPGSVPGHQQAMVLVLALAALVLGLFPEAPLELLSIGRPAAREVGE